MPEDVVAAGLADEAVAGLVLLDAELFAVGDVLAPLDEDAAAPVPLELDEDGAAAGPSVPVCVLDDDVVGALELVDAEVAELVLFDVDADWTVEGL